MIFALIPAGGKSERMGRPKLTLPFKGKTVLECVLGAVRRAGIEHILVVVGPHVPELGPLAESAGAQVLALTEATPHLRDTVELGLKWIEERFHPRPDDRWFLVPADHPMLDDAVFAQLLAARDACTTCSIVIPTYEGKRGHPTLLDWTHAAGIRAFPAGGRLNAYVRQQAAATLEVPVNSAGVVRDLDTQKDYARLLESCQPAE
jgi:molybdenum cofactor cytidylyltransferase